MSDVKKVSTITWISILIRRFNRLEKEFHEVFKRPLNDYWTSLIGLKVNKFDIDFLGPETRGQSFKSRVEEEYGDEVWDILSQLLMTDYEIDRTIKEDVAWEGMDG